MAATQLPGGTYTTTDPSGRQQIIQRTESGGLRYVYADTPAGQELLAADQAQANVNNFFTANPNATPDEIAQAATESGATAEQIAKATGADVETIRTGLEAYTQTGSTGQTAQTYTPSGLMANQTVQTSTTTTGAEPSQDAIGKLADLYYLAMSGGVNSAQLRNAVSAAGGDPSDPFAANKILSDAGYTPGDTQNFYTSAGAEPTDERAKAIVEGRASGALSAGNNTVEQVAYLRSQGYEKGVDAYDEETKQAILEKEEEFRSGLTPGTLEDLLKDFSSDEMQRYNQLNELYRNLFGRDVAFAGADYWIRGGGSAAQLTEETLAAAALGSDLDYYTTNVLNPRQFQELLGSFTPSEQSRYNQVNELYNKLFGRDVALEGTEYWIRGGGSSAPLTEETLIAAAQGEDLEYYNTFVKLKEFSAEDYNTYLTDLKSQLESGALTEADAYTQIFQDINRLRNERYNIPDADVAQYVNSVFGTAFTPEQVANFLESGYVPPDSQFQDLASFLETLTPEQTQKYQELNDLYVDLFGRNVGLVGAQYWLTGEGSTVDWTRQSLINAATGSDLDYYNNKFNSGDDTDGGGSPREAIAGSIVAGTPQAGEVNIMDYLGLQAGDPTLPTGTKLSTQVEKITPTTGADGEMLELLPDISTVDSTKLGTDDVTASATKVASEVEGTATVPGQVTVPTSADVSADIIEASEFTEADVPSQFVDPVTGKLKTEDNLATMSAEKSYTDIDKQANAFTAAKQELADVNPLATVTGQLAILQKQFADGNVPVWAQGAFRQVNALMAQRGIGGSTMAAEAITNALMQSAIPIAQQDASFYQNVTLQNLSNEQQAEMAKFNARTASIFNDQAAVNAARSLNTQEENALTRFFAELATNVSTTNAQMSNSMEQFNATAKNQMTQFIEELGLTAETFNADQLNEMSQFDAEQANIIAQFNASMKNQREQFNVNNQLAIDASNVNWRRDVNTANTSATNAALQFDAQNLLGIQQTALNNIWQHFDTLLNYAFTAEESAANRANQIVISSMNAEMQRQIAESTSDSDLISGIFRAGATLLGSETGNTVVSEFLGIGK